jgi:biopolymer transport protein ExbD
MPLKTTTDEMPALNLTSMIDVTFVLIIFFMVGTQFINPERDINLEVPQVGSAGALSEAPARKVINVFEDGRIELAQEPMTLDQLAARLSASRAQYADLGVLVRGDARTDFQRVAEVLNACRQAGIAELGISVKVAQTARRTR